MPTLSAEVENTVSTNALGIEVYDVSDDSDISMDVQTSRGSPLTNSQYVTLLNQMDEILKSSDNDFIP